MYLILLLSFFLNLLSCHSNALAFDQGNASGCDTGTVIVTYHTETEAERLGRVRFILRSENNKECMYPRGNAYVEDQEGLSRMVAIENLPVGTYELKFLIPNADNLFEEVPKRNITVAKDAVLRVDQNIHPRTDTSLIAEIQKEAIIAASSIESRLGTLTIEAAFPEDETVQIIIQPRNAPAISVSLKARAGKIIWQSPPLPAGAYQVSYILPEGFLLVPSDHVILKAGEHLQLNPQLVSEGSLHVIANIPEAIFLLRIMKGNQAWRGEGREFTFYGLSAGSYILSFSTQNPDYYIPPKEMRFYLSELQNKEIKATFQIAGRLIVKTNVDRGRVTVQQLGGLEKKYVGEIFDHSKAFSLPEGRYRVTLSDIQTETPANLKWYPPDPVIVEVHALRSEELNLSYRLESTQPIEKQKSLIVTTNISSGGFTINKIVENEAEAVGHYYGKFAQITLPKAERFEVVFDNVPNYQTPAPLPLYISHNNEYALQATYTPIQLSVPIPAGKAIIGDPMGNESTNEMQRTKTVTIKAFALGTYEVTNAQYATWLNQALKQKKIAYVKEADDRGKVIDMQGRLLFKTFDADPYSQISAQLHSDEIPSFLPLPGKDSYPVINVSWYGAMAYCNDNECRLPTEAEWEKAAGMAPTAPGVPLKKFRFGFSKDTIDPTLANYKSDDRIIQYFQVLTTPVGFYDGNNTLMLSPESTGLRRTHLAVSPYGAYDMSGNVWEWVSDWYDEEYYKNMPEEDPQGPATGTLKVVKGGSYDSLKDGVRVAERLGLPPDHTDAYTGFRVAFSKK